MSDTPETEAVSDELYSGKYEFSQIASEALDFARKLERERDEARRVAAAWKDEAVFGDAVPDDDREFLPWER